VKVEVSQEGEAWMREGRRRERMGRVESVREGIVVLCCVVLCCVVLCCVVLRYVFLSFLISFVCPLSRHREKQSSQHTGEEILILHLILAE
jgi:hypothetical protein